MKPHIPCPIKLKNAGIVFDHTNHQKLWNWLADNPGKEKHDWPGWQNIKEKFFGYCFACDYDDKAYEITNRDTCDCCPLLWEGKGCSLPNSLYSQWLLAYGAERCRELALKIANVKVRKGVVTK